MGTPEKHWKLAEQCVAMAQAAAGDRDKALWLTLAQSWVRLAERVERAETYPRGQADGGGDRGEVQSAIAHEVC